MPAQQGIIRVGFYGAGRFVSSTHLPNLQRLDNVKVIALSDVDEGARRAVAQQAGLDLSHAYADGHAMLANEEMDILYSCVPAFARSDVEIAAAGRGIHIFSEKPQAVDIGLARAIADAIDAAGIYSTVGFRERYRPMFQEIRRLLASQEIVHVRCELPRTQVPPSESWIADEQRSGGHFLDWGVHAVDYVRFMTGQNITTAQAFYYRHPSYSISLSSSFHFVLSNGGTMTLSFIAYPAGDDVKDGRSSIPRFTIYHVNGRVDVYRDGGKTWSYEHNGVPIVTDEDFDPWFAQDQTFVETVRTGREDQLLNDYADGLHTLAPILAGWYSAKHGGAPVDVAAFLDGQIA